MALGQYDLVLLGIKSKWVNTRLLCLYILKKKKVEIWSGVTDVNTQRQTNRQTATYSAAQLV